MNLGAHMPSNARHRLAHDIVRTRRHPRRLYSATIASERLAFNLLRQNDGSRVKRQYVAVNDGALVERSEMTKGYELAKDQYVMFTAEELKALEDTTTHTIDITQFVPLESVDPVYFDGTYFLAPDKGGAKPYSLLTTALKKAKQCAVGRWISRGKEHIVILRPMDDGLAIISCTSKPKCARSRTWASKRRRCRKLSSSSRISSSISSRPNDLDPNQYVDEHRGRVEAAIQRKVEGKEVSIAEPSTVDGGRNVVDLMEALKASLNARGGKAEAKNGRRRKRHRRREKPSLPKKHPSDE